MRLALTVLLLIGLAANSIAPSRAAVDDGIWNGAGSWKDSTLDDTPAAGRAHKASRKLLRAKFARAATANEWSMIWNDEFESLDANNWGYQVGDGCSIGLCGWGNAEYQYYTDKPGNARVVDGKLVIEAREERGVELAAVQQHCWDDCGYRCAQQGLKDGSPALHACVLACGESRCPQVRFTSARLITAGKFTVSPSDRHREIRIEARISLTPGSGLWPAFWALPASTEKYGIWPTSGEIDIMESHGEMDQVNGTIHYGGPGEAHRYTTHATDLSPGFHVFRVDWSEKEIKWYVDGVRYGSVQNMKGRRGWWADGADDIKAPFAAGDDFYLLLNLAVGGSYTGFAPADAVARSLNDGPKQMVVDWVRVFGR